MVPGEREGYHHGTGCMRDMQAIHHPGIWGTCRLYTTRVYAGCTYHGVYAGYMQGVPTMVYIPYYTLPGTPTTVPCSRSCTRSRWGHRWETAWALTWERAWAGASCIP